MKGLHKFRLKYLVTGVLTTLLFFTQTWKSAGNHVSFKYFDIALTESRDTTPLKNKSDSIPVKGILNPSDTIPQLKTDSLNNITDTSKNHITIDTFSLKMSKDSLEAPVYYEAEDSAVVLVKEKKVVLYGRTKTNYTDIELTAPKVELDQQTQILTAFSSKDSTGEIIERAKFKQGTEGFQSDTIQYNFKTQKGLTKNTFTQQQGVFIQSDLAKKISKDITFASHGVLTTCNLDDPHFGFRYNKIKVVNNKVAVTGPVHPEFEGVPVPIYLPFGFFPLKQGRHSGFLPPQFTANEDFGLGLEGMGYYKVLNEYFDVTVRSNIYSYGGWSVSATPTYRRRYRYNGTMNFSLQNTKFNFKGDPDYIKSKSFQINWTHSVDSKARPGTTFSANVNAGSTRYNDYIPNNPYRNFQNQLNSSITYSKTWIGKPYNLTVSANHSQNNATRLVNLNLPDVGFTVSTVYPFQRKEIIGSSKWYEKLGLAYNGNIRSQVSFYDTAFRFQQLIDTLQWGAQHNFPITLSLPAILGGKLILSPNLSYEQKWIAQKFRRTWNATDKKLDTSVTKGFFTDHKLGFGLGMNTALYGTFQFKKSRIIAIRHVIRPSLSFNYSPSLSKQHFYETQVDTFGRRLRFSEYEGSLYGSYGEQDFGGLGFGVDNNLEMKWRSRKDTGQEAIKKIRLVDGYGFNSGYNFIADSFKLSPFSFYLRSTLFEKINISASTTMTPYQADSLGFPIDKYYWQGGKFKPGRITNGGVSISTDFRSKPKDQKKEDERKKRQDEAFNDPLLAGDQRRLADYMRRNPNEFVDFNIPWSVSLGLSIYFSERLKPDYSGFQKEFNSNLNFNGTFNLTEKWNFSVNGYYDFDTRNLQTFSMSISRDMHCWQLSISVTPVGPFRFFNFTISPKSGLLQDLKINRTRYFYSY
ncbi:MAG: LPS-assembly protein LptD [Chitinophagaceae bacterium]|nr:MAG: LPS-assembly protein LptD [Chitinophagaceae bacterium]